MKVTAKGVAPERSNLSGMHGLREQKSFTEKVGGARAIGPRRAAKVFSPTRDSKEWRLNFRAV